MNEQGKAKILDPTALDLATIRQLIDELQKRHHSMIICLFPLIANNGVQKPDFFAYGNYYLNLSMAMNVADQLRFNNPLRSQEQT